MNKWGMYIKFSEMQALNKPVKIWRIRFRNVISHHVREEEKDEEEEEEVEEKKVGDEK